MFSGFLPIYKPAGISSFDVIRHIYRLLRNKLHIPKKSQKIGHTGTLDPFAQGVLLLAFGKATRLIEYGLHKHKTYIFTLKFGEQTDTADKEGKIIASNNIMPSEGDILTSIPYFIGEITQIPPRFSAVKIAGKPAYKLARTGQDFTIKPRTTFIKQLRLLNIKDDYAMFQCEALAGTYIRSLAEDLAKRAGAIGHLTYLEREKDGVFTTKDCLDLASITALISGKNIDGDIATDIAVDMEGDAGDDAGGDAGDDVKNRIIQKLESNLYPLKTYLEDGNLHIQNYNLSELTALIGVYLLAIIKIIPSINKIVTANNYLQYARNSLSTLSKNKVLSNAV